MLILGIDTSGRQGSVALLQAQGGQLLTLELAPLSGGQYSEVLVPAIAALLLRHGLEKCSLSLIAVASGPGSFTGLRVAIATAKGLAEAFAIPVVPVSVLEAILFASEAEGRAVAAIDAQRGEVFFGETIAGEAGAELCLREDIAAFADFVSALASGSPSPMVLTPDEGLASRLREAALPGSDIPGSSFHNPGFRDPSFRDPGFEVALVARPSAEDFARIAHCKFLAGCQADVATLDANYVRRSEAEILSTPKLGLLR